MASLLTKRLSKLPIGTHVELTYGNGTSHHEIISGIVTDSDFTSGIEVTPPEGEGIVLDFSIIRGSQVLKDLETVLKELPVGTNVLLAYGAEDQREPNISAVVIDNDNEESIEIKCKDGKEIIVNYDLVRALLVVKTSDQPNKPNKPDLPVPHDEQEPEDILNVNDAELKEKFDRIPSADKKKLGSAYESFKYGIKINDRSKIKTAAEQARTILFREDEQNYYWSREAVRFCVCLLRRVNIFDCEVALVAECFEEAAFICWHNKEYTLSGAYAILALMGKESIDVKNNGILLSCAVQNTNDVSALHILAEHCPDDRKACLQAVIAGAFRAKKLSVSVAQDTSTALTLLATLYPGKEMVEEVTYWLPEDMPPVPQPEPEPKPKAPVQLRGTIKKLNWAVRTGEILSDAGELYPFTYADITDPKLNQTIRECMRMDLGGKTYHVCFMVENDQAKVIRPAPVINPLQRDGYSGLSPVDRARKLITYSKQEDRFERAYALCKQAVGTPDARRALEDMIRHASAIFKASYKTEQLKEALSLYEKNITLYPANAFAVMMVAQAYAYLTKFPQMMEHAEKALNFPGLQAKQKAGLLSQYLTLVRQYYEVSGDKALLSDILSKTTEFSETYASDLSEDTVLKEVCISQLLHHRVFAEFGLNMLEEAEADIGRYRDDASIKATLSEQLEKLKAQLAAPAETTDVPTPTVQEEVAEERGEDREMAELAFPEDEDYDESASEDAPEEEIVPYSDPDGWSALGLGKKDVIDYALGITGEDRIPAILAYLRAAATLNPDLEPIYQSVALAANDPMESPDYSITTLANALEAGDADYAELHDCCMSAAFLRASFLADRGYDYSASALRNGISLSHSMPALADAYNTMEEFRENAGRAIDIYADYRNHNVKKINEDLAFTVHRADELYTKFILSPAREGVKFARLLKTKQIVFARDGYLACMLQYLIAGDQEAMEREKANFVATFLNGVEQFSAKLISSKAVDDLIGESWALAGRSMMLKKSGATLQGDRRNNLRSNIIDILHTICQWYALTEQSAGITWRNQIGEETYLRLRPRLVEQLSELSEDCLAQMEGCDSAERSTGLFILSKTAKELVSRLDGTWTFDREKYMYVDFLRSDYVMLNEDFMPELESTFCILPGFNILKRIRQHVEAPKPSFQECIDRIYGPDKACNNYGAADKIIAYLEAIGEEDSAELPPKSEQFRSQTEMQIEMQFRSFREMYALAMSYGQIIKSDVFCYTLEDTVRYWYSFCKESKNYGFFISILRQAENQIHACAQQYEVQLDEQLDALIAKNRQYFDTRPDYAEAIREQISDQNFTVAEDWMARIRIGDFSLDVQQPEAIKYLERFWNSYAVTYNQVADAGSPLEILLRRRTVHNKDTKRAQQLIDNWLCNGKPTNTVRIANLLNLLGWQNICVSQYQFPGDPRAEIYEVTKAVSAVGLSAPLHPIAEFGSRLEKKRMYAVCLYGVYDCDRLFEKMRSFDVIDGSKIFLLDYALGQTDRRALARKLKKRESGLRNMSIVIDRVLITHLADIYNENLINRILMADAVPFTYCQPYVVESVHTMPPEIFIGRKDELLKIEQHDGVNLIYGGRQLGKSALFKKALADIDGHQKRRAVLIDISGLDCKASAEKVSKKLIDLDILSDGEITDDWDVLCRSIEQKLRNSREEITYFLLMLDEADDFIEDCANCGYRPLVALKDVQQSLPGQFKYVLAGLHNIVKFNRQVALGNNSVITHMSSLKITPFRTPEAQELLTGPLSYLGFSLPSKVTISQILATCNYFPGLIQLYAKKLIESVRTADYAGYDVKKTPPYIVSDEHLRRIMADKEFVDQIYEKFEITLTLDKDQGSCYYPLALLIGWMYNVSPSKSGYTAKDVLSHAKDLSILPLAALDEDKIDALLLELQDLNILRSVANNSYLLASKNFRDLLGSDEEIFEKLSGFGGSAE